MKDGRVALRLEVSLERFYYRWGEGESEVLNIYQSKSNGIEINYPKHLVLNHNHELKRIENECFLSIYTKGYSGTNCPDTCKTIKILEKKTTS